MKGAWQGIIDRMSGPLYGYVSVSLVLFNWKWIALLFMSKYPVEVRITVIEQYFNWLVGLAAPLGAGIAAALLTPFFHVILAFAHRWAIKLSLLLETYKAADKAEADKAIAVSDAKSQWAASIAEAAEELEQKRIQQLAVEVETNIVRIREDAIELYKHHDENIAKFEILKNEMIASISMLNGIKEIAENYEDKIPISTLLSQSIAERRDFIDDWQFSYGNESNAPDFLRLNPAGLHPKTTVSSEE
ncbi:hypothetical protein LJN55_22665 [Erwinia rhapontici]|uniref:hypothetical protein n=1 Tax=Erwinia rhapontici TaxID=55212 RepID=UPI001D0D956B|nr:hypothetical protein [Erwinia rhapontici]UDQ80163.1 hypothetical protein LJN55_22665 [Erwinia rhapontici]